MTKKQREEIENFIKQDISTMTFPQAQAIAQAILENHDMLEKLTGLEQTKEQIKPIRISIPIEMDSPQKIAKKIRKSMREIMRCRV